MESKKIVSTLKEVNEFVNDGAKGYRKAAIKTEDTHLKMVFDKYAGQREKFAKENNTFITKYGGKPEESGTIKGALFRQWMNVKSTFTGNEDEGLITSSKYGEEWAQKAYNDALEKEGLPLEVKQELTRQREASREAYQELEKEEAAHQH